MGRIDEKFSSLRERGEKALIPFLTVGDPDMETTEAMVLSMAEAGADLIELGVPFSDPTAEGPVIQRASERALKGGTSLRGILGMVDRLRAKVDIPLLLMGYANPLHAMGPVPFAEAAASVGVDGIIIPDVLPLGWRGAESNRVSPTERRTSSDTTWRCRGTGARWWRELYVFEHDGSHFAELVILFASDAASSNQPYFGTDLALSGDASTFVVGAPTTDIHANDAGQV